MDTQLVAMSEVPGGVYDLGTNSDYGFPTDLEGPVTSVPVGGFLIDITTVTVAQFREFINETHYETDAEKYGWSFVFGMLLDSRDKAEAQVIAQTPWWSAVDGANWQHPFGPHSEAEDENPVVQVSRNDALVFCQWAGKRLPTEAEWEVAAKGGTLNDRLPWGDGLDFHLNGKLNCNTWQGNFPTENTAEDGYVGLAPAKSYVPNGYGLYQVIGNVWEWCLNPSKLQWSEFVTHDSDYFIHNYSRPDNGEYAMRGGSFLCHESYCRRYRIAARNSNNGDSTSCNLGFRCVADG